MQKTKMEKVNELIRMSVTPTVADSFILIAEKAISDYRAELHSLIEPFKKLEEPYLAAKAKMENLEKDIKHYEAVLETISRAKQKDNSPEFRMNRATSHTQSKKRNIVVKWNAELGAILRQENRFMSYVDLIEALFKRHPNLRTVDGIDRKVQQQLGNMKSGEIDVMRRKENGSKNNRKDSAELLRYNNMWGLAEWVDDHFVPLPAYMKQFVYQNAS